MIHSVIADAIANSSVAISPQEQHALAQDISYAIDSISKEEMLIDLFEDIEQVRRVMDELA
jgi:hypothetical protein